MSQPSFYGYPATVTLDVMGETVDISQTLKQDRLDSFGAHSFDYLAIIRTIQSAHEKREERCCCRCRCQP